MKTKSCSNCCWSRWVLTRNGGIKMGTYGICVYEVKMPEVPACQRSLFNDRVAIWPKDGVWCTCHQPGGKPMTKFGTEF